jgi:hypothetical protein
MVNLDRVIVFDHSTIIQFLMNFVFSKRMLYVIVFDLVAPAVVEVVDFASNFSAQLNIKGFVNFAEASLTENTKD